MTNVAKFYLVQLVGRDVHLCITACIDGVYNSMIRKIVCRAQ